MCTSKHYRRIFGWEFKSEIFGVYIVIFTAFMIPLIICGMIYGGENNPSYRYHVNAKIISVGVVKHVGGSNVVYNVIGSDNSTCVIITEVDSGQIIYKVNDTISITPLDIKAGTCDIYTPNGSNPKPYLIVTIVSGSIIAIIILVVIISCCVKRNCSDKYWVANCDGCCKCYMVCCDDISNIIKLDNKLDSKVEGLPTYQSIA